MNDSPATDARRPLTSRNTAWARWLARRLAATEVTPNQISLASIGFALIGGVLLLRPDWPVAMVFAAICIQLRLLCNLIDGMVAVEGGKGTPVGALYNEVPDRVALTLSGHTHGGQVQLLGYAPIVPSVYGRRYLYGHIEEEERHLIVSGGLGCSGVPLRFGRPPEIVMIELGEEAKVG